MSSSRLVVLNRDVKNVIKQTKNVKKRFLFRKNKKRYKKRINTINTTQLIHNAGDGQYPGYAFLCGQWNSRLSINKPL